MSLSVVEMLTVKRFVLIYHGYGPPTPDFRKRWDEWFRRRAASFADTGHVFGPGRLVTNDRTIDLSLRSNPASGYSIVNAEHLDAAEQLLEGCPIVGSVSLYEALANPGQPATGANP